MLNPVLSPELAMILKEEALDYLSDGDMLNIEHNCLQAIEIDAQFDAAHPSCNALTVTEEPLDLASELEPGDWLLLKQSKYLPNTGTPRIERFLRRQGLRKAEDDTREQVQELYIELFNPVTRRTHKLHVLRQLSGDLIV